MVPFLACPGQSTDFVTDSAKIVCLNITIRWDKLKVSGILTMPTVLEMVIFFWRDFIGCMNDNNIVSKSLDRKITYHNLLWYSPPGLMFNAKVSHITGPELPVIWYVITNICSK